MSAASSKAAPATTASPIVISRFMGTEAFKDEPAPAGFHCLKLC
jgi:hypothetical protein